METRTKWQDYNEGQGENCELFWCEAHKDIECLGVQIGSVIYYVVTALNSNECVLMIGINMFRDAVKAIYEYSSPRFEVLNEHCPTLCQAILDGSEARLDRGGIAGIDGYYMLVKKLNYNITKDVKNNPNIFYETDSIVTETALSLIEQFNTIIDEMTKWEGFSTWEEMKIGAKEALPGVTWGLRLGRIFGF